MRKFWLGAVVASVALLAASGAQARNLGYADILGTWCGKEAKFVFTRGSLTVTWYGSSDRRVLAVKEYVFSPTSINVKWKPKGNTV
jgi:hypothetical protein